MKALGMAESVLALGFTTTAMVLAPGCPGA